MTRAAWVRPSPQIRCESTQARDWQREGSDKLTSDELDQIDKYNVEQCYSNTAKGYSNLTGAEFIPTVTTDTAARDMDIIRSVVGQSKLTYLGYSYGTRLGYYYAMKFPRNVRAMILDGDTNIFDKNEEMQSAARYTEYNPDISQSQEATQAKSFNATFRQFLKWCLTTSDISSCAVGDHVDGTPTDAQIDAAYARYQAIARRTWGGIDAKLKDGRVLSFSDFTVGTNEAMYSQSRWPSLNNALASFDADGDGTQIMVLSDEYMGRGTSYHYDDESHSYESVIGYDTSQSAFTVIYAQDNIEPSDPADYTEEEREEASRKHYAACPYRDPGVDADGTQRGLSDGAGEEAFFSTGGQLQPVYEMSTLPNILVISSTYDPATPYANGVVTARALRGTLLIVANDQHCAYGNGSGHVDCATSVGDSYILDPDGFTSSIDTGAYRGNAVWKGDSNVTTKDIYSTVITGDQCQLVSFRPSQGDTVVKAISDQLTDGKGGNKRNVELGSTAKDGQTDATTEGTSVSLRSGSADVTKAAQGDSLRAYLGGMTTDCTKPNAGCTYAAYLYPTASGSSPIAMGGAAAAQSDGDDYYVALTVPRTVAAGDYKVAVYRENGWLYGWTTLTVAGTPAAQPAGSSMYRLYNPFTGEHFYTASGEERDGLTGAGWRDEGVGWIAPAVEGAPVYRLYNPIVGDHHYTMSGEERDSLVNAGWRYEGVGWYSADASGGQPLFRQYNPNAAAGAHNYSVSGEERDSLMGVGWRDEGISWYGLFA